MFNPSTIMRRDAENRDTRVGEVSGLTTTGGGVLGGVLGNCLLVLESGRDIDVFGGVLGGVFGGVFGGSFGRIGSGARCDGEPFPAASSCLPNCGKLCCVSSSGNLGG